MESELVAVCRNATCNDISGAQAAEVSSGRRRLDLAVSFSYSILSSNT